MAAAIQVDDLHVHYRSARGKWVAAVRGLSFRVEQGEAVGFIGPNGAGKSSTIKALMGFTPPTKGSATILGHPAGSVSANALVGYLPEVALYYPYLTPAETLRLYGELQGIERNLLRTQTEELLNRLGLAGLARTRNRNLSKGQLQRVGIAQSLLGDPKVLILDEVTSGLDPIGRQDLRRLLKERQRGGCTLFFSSHELSEVESICDRILLVHRGRLIEERDVADLKGELRKYALAYVPPGDACRPRRITEREQPRAIWVEFERKEQLLEEIVRVQAQGAVLVDVVAQDGSLEEYFIDVVSEAA